MKRMKSTIWMLIAVAVTFAACEKQEDQVFLLTGKSPVLSVSSDADLVLLKAQENYSSLQFQWTNPEFEFSNGANTQDVLYVLQVDTVGSNFSNPKSAEVAFTNQLSTTFKVKDLNNTLGVMELKDYEPHEFEFRIKATFPNGAVPIYSNPVAVTITTYLDVVYPVPANLYITGAATPKSWMSGGDPEELTQKFTKVNAYTFQISSLAITAGKGYLFVPVYGNWSNKYGFTGDKEKNNPSGDFFKPEGNDFISPAVSKNYKITVNFKTGKFSFE